MSNKKQLKKNARKKAIRKKRNIERSARTKVDKFDSTLAMKKRSRGNIGSACCDLEIENDGLDELVPIYTGADLQGNVIVHRDGKQMVDLRSKNQIN